MKEGRARKRCLFIKANVPIVCQADRQPWGVQLERDGGSGGFMSREVEENQKSRGRGCERVNHTQCE